jgi:Rieske Fe-S protein
LFWDTTDPYYYFRVQRLEDQDYVIFGGLDHKTGQETDASRCFDELEEMLHRFLPQAETDHRWSGQVIESIDGLPYIGQTAERQFVATGFSGNGLTFGTLAGIMARDAALGLKNPWHELFDVRRKKLSGVWNFVRENADYPYYLLKDWLTKSEGQTLQDVARGEGKILTIDGRRTAVYRDSDGRTTKLSPVCTHLGCIVHWNEVENTWDCPCHGSRFHATGEVLAGPAETALKATHANAQLQPRADT